MLDLRIIGGRLVGTDRVERLDIGIQNGKIAGIYTEGNAPEAAETLDAAGLLLFPGMIDTHVHLNDPGYTWRETFAEGTAAAAIGGATTVIDMPLQNTPAMTSAAILSDKLAAVAGQARVDYAFWGGLTDENFDHLAGLRAAGVVAFKSFIGPVSDDYRPLSYGQAREALEILGALGCRVGFHCEDPSIIRWQEARLRRQGRTDWRAFLDSRPPVAELLATEAILLLAGETGAPVHICHVSHPAVAARIREAQRAGIDVTAETCGHYLSFTEEDLLREGGLYKCAPPLRTAEARDALWEYLLDGTIGMVCSDHSPCAAEEKDAGRLGVFDVWGGISGVQTTLQLLYEEGVRRRGLSPCLLARVLGAGPADAFGLAGRKGRIAPGLDADLVLFDPDRRWTVTPESLGYHNRISAFCGYSGVGMPVRTLLRGRTVALEGRPTGEMGYGMYICREK